MIATGCCWARSYHDFEHRAKDLHPTSAITSWTPLDTRWIKLNSNDSIFKVEARALLEGLLLALDKGFKKVEI